MRVIKLGVCLGLFNIVYMTKKHFKYIFLGASLLTMIFFVSPVLAQEGIVKCGLSGTETCTWNDLFILMNDVINFLIFKLGIPLVTIAIVVSGVQLVIKRDSGSYSNAKENLKTALWGLVIMLTAFLIVKVVVWGLTGGDSTVTDPYELRGKLQDSSTQ